MTNLCSFQCKAKKGLPSDIIASSKNDAQIMTIVTRSGRSLAKYVIDIDKYPNEKESDEQANRKRRWLKMSNNDVPNLNEPIV